MHRKKNHDHKCNAVMHRLYGHSHIFTYAGAREFLAETNSSGMKWN